MASFVLMRFYKPFGNFGIKRTANIWDQAASSQLLPSCQIRIAGYVQQHCSFNRAIIVITAVWLCIILFLECLISQNPFEQKLFHKLYKSKCFRMTCYNYNRSLLPIFSVLIYCNSVSYSLSHNDFLAWIQGWGMWLKEATLNCLLMN